MYGGMVSTDHGRTRKVTSQTRSQQQQDQQQQQQQQLRERNRSGQTKSIYGRLWDFMKHAWTGVKFALGKFNFPFFQSRKENRMERTSFPLFVKFLQFSLLFLEQPFPLIHKFITEVTKELPYIVSSRII